MKKNYVQDIATAKYGNLFRMVIKWKGGLWKTVYKELLVWIIAFAILSCVYRFALQENQKRTFEKIVVTCYTYETFMPLTFMLGFYVQIVIERWWVVIRHMGIIDDMALMVAAYLRGPNKKSIQYKRTILRYMCLFQIMIYRSASSTVYKKYPHLRNLVECGYLLPKEREIFNEHEIWLPVQWSISLAMKAREEKLIKSDHFVAHIIQFLEEFHTTQRVIWIYSWINIPLAYTQVVFITVRLYFLLALVGRQFIENDPNQLDIYVPVFTIFQFIFYVGWLKVAEALLNPLGADDNDFEAVYFLERNHKTAFQIMDSAYDEPPPLIVDRFLKEERELALKNTQQL